MTILEIKDLSYTYSDQTAALEKISFSVKERKKIAILGANGSGKSTLLQHLNGLILPQAGIVSIKDTIICKKNLSFIRKTVGIVFDNPEDQLFSTTVYEDIAFGPRNLGYTEEKVQECVERAISLVNIQDLSHRPPYNLSLGQKKKVAIAGVVAMEPEIMVFDEPFSGLDPYSLEQFIYLLDNLYDAGHTLLITTHDVDIAYGWADECILLKEGKVLAQGPMDLLEDQLLMKKARLKVPSLCQIFHDTNMQPKTIGEAREALNKLLNPPS
ncbi:cobalt transport protein ATP-binding subunit [Clostridium aceticum]|uniref:ABC transporter ATP-binding protein n=1 Tax=Clostridium aceticum TaxID=84022 RepID=A0A0D8I866_9CLOT|nr:ATP-binding cassette domain-containing protein [Clostridium aceticum]AKL97240.1 cobalt transport protein ATP-binding subunit [Clostridium aceticum]KJF26269.1 cobalt ABC transporter ATPase [Clostridium aceticum]